MALEEAVVSLATAKTGIAAAILLVLGWIAYARIWHPLSKTPGPFLASISRVWYVYHMMRGDIDKTNLRVHDKYGPIIRIAPDEVSISDPEAIKTIYGINSGFTKTDFYRPFAADVSKYPDHFSGTDEKLHSQRRRIVNAVYSTASILKSEKYVDNCSREFASHMKQYADTQEVVDMGTWLNWYAFDVIGELFFGNMFGFMRNRTDHQGWIETLEPILPIAVVSAAMPSYCRKVVLLGALSARLRSALGARDRIVQAAKDCVTLRRQQMANNEELRQDMLGKLFDIYTEKGEKEDFTLIDVENESFGAIFAGADTTAIALRAIVYYLMKTPAALKKLQQELDDAALEKRISFPVRYADAICLPYLTACIKEGMRMHPSVGAPLPRRVPEGGREIAGHYFKEGCKVGVNAWVVHCDESVFGEDARTYNPDRWIERDAVYMDRYMFQFGAGARTCIGKNISLIEMYKLIPMIMYYFEFEFAPDHTEWKIRNYMFTKQEDFKVKVKHREHRFYEGDIMSA